MSYNRLDSYTRSVLDGLFSDVRYLYSRETDWRRDIVRLSSQLEARGQSILLLEFPALLKHFDQCLDKGVFTRSNQPLTRPKNAGEEIPVFLREIYLHIFDTQGFLLASASADAVLALRTIYGTFKKLRFSSERRHEYEEVNNFLHVDRNLRYPTLQWNTSDYLFPIAGEESRLARSLHLRDLEPSSPTLPGIDESRGSGLSRAEIGSLQRCFDIVASKFGLPPHMLGGGSRSLIRPRNGPGAVSEMLKGSSKYEFPNWAPKLQHLFPRDYYALPGFGGGFSCDRDLDSGVDGLAHELPSRVIAVPKTFRKPRLIAAEPASNQWIQQLLSQELEARISDSFLRNSINLRDQTLSQREVVKASVHAHKATVDLSEASDRISCALIERAWRSNHEWLNAFHACRTRYVSYDRGNGKEYLLLNKFSTMGSALTFPVQSVLFTTIAIAATLSHMGIVSSHINERWMEETSYSVRVYGDDIIVGIDALDTLVRMLEYCGLKVNTAKTFSGFHFRESCGMDAFRGEDVTPPRVLEVPNGSFGQVASLVETSNNFHKKGFWRTAQAIFQYCEKWEHLIPISDTPDFAVYKFSYCGKREDHLKKRVNPRLQRTEIRVIIPRTKMLRTGISARARLLQYFTEEPRADNTDWASGLAPSGLTKNQPGWVAATL